MLDDKPTLASVSSGMCWSTIGFQANIQITPVLFVQSLVAVVLSHLVQNTRLILIQLFTMVYWPILLLSVSDVQLPEQISRV